jgi:hypothetical protein
VLLFDQNAQLVTQGPFCHHPRVDRTVHHLGAGHVFPAEPRLPLGCGLRLEPNFERSFERLWLVPKGDRELEDGGHLRPVRFGRRSQEHPPLGGFVKPPQWTETQEPTVGVGSLGPIRVFDDIVREGVSHRREHRGAHGLCCPQALPGQEPEQQGGGGSESRDPGGVSDPHRGRGEAQGVALDLL